MISIIVCSINAEMLKKFKENIAATINSVYEVIAFDNSILNKSICAIYNLGTNAAKYDIIAFCHEDIIFDTHNWDAEVEILLKDKVIGLIGISGAIYKSKYPTSWNSIPSQYYRSNLIEVGGKKMDSILDFGTYSRVAVLDGCFIAGRKELFKKYKWNEKNLDGFHMYDIDISLQVGKSYINVVSNNILIKHLSVGNMGYDWLIESENYHKVNKASFPLSIGGFSKLEQRNLNYCAIINYFFIACNMNCKIYKKIQIISKAILTLPFKKNNFSMIKFLFKSKINA